LKIPYEDEEQDVNEANERLEEARYFYLQSLRVAAPQQCPQQPKAMTEDDKFLAENNLSLGHYTDFIQFIRYKIQMIAPYDSEHPYHAKFSNDCLEYRLDQRLTHYNPDNTDDIKVLLAVSGAGKTRLLLELLYSRHGYYFVSQRDQADFGSGDLMICRKFAEKDPLNTDYYIKLLYFVRSEVCKYLMELGYDKPCELLLAQLHPIQFFGGKDVFSELFTLLASYGRTVRNNLVGCFDFAVIDEIHATMTGATVYRNNTRFFTPLIYHSKMFGRFPVFMVAGTGLDFSYLHELMQSNTFKKSSLKHQLVSCLEPLDASQVCEYSRFVLDRSGIDQGLVEGFVKAVSEFPRCHGRARFIACLLDSFIQDPYHDVSYAIHKFIIAITNVQSNVFPLRFYREDQRTGLNKVVGYSTLHRICSEGLIEFMMKGVATLYVKDADASKAIEGGLGFCEKKNIFFSSLVLKELAVIDCLRSLIPFHDIVVCIALRLCSVPKPQWVCYTLKYLVAFGLVAKLNPNKLHELKPSKFSFPQYIEFAEPNEIYFPNDSCGPDIVYKHNGILNLISVKFVGTISKQERMQACRTTDPNYFYWNSKGNMVVKGFEEERNTILSLLDGMKCKRMVFLHMETKTTAEMEGVEVINEKNCPTIFDAVFEIWPFLNELREQFNEE